MLRNMLKSKLHQATVTSSRLHYQGSLAIDKDLMAAADISEGEQIHVYNITNGHRFVTYAVPAPSGSHEIGILGAAARLAAEGDCLIILTYALYDDADLEHYQPTIVVLTGDNRIKLVKHKTTQD